MGINSISKEIRDLKEEMKDDFQAFCEDLQSDMKKDLDHFKQKNKFQNHFACDEVTIWLVRLLLGMPNLCYLPNDC